MECIEASDGLYIPATEITEGRIYRLGFEGCLPLKFIGFINDVYEFNQYGCSRYVNSYDMASRISDRKIWVKVHVVDAKRRQQIATQLLAALLSNSEYLTEALPNLVLDAVNATDLLLQELNKGDN